MTKLTLIISGMTCGGCVNSVTRVLQATAGVRDVAVSLLPSQAKLEYDEAIVSPEQLAQAVSDAGFSVVEIRD